MDGNWQRRARAQAREAQSPTDAGRQPLERMGEVAVRSAALWWDLQMEAARTMWRSQARAAAMLGVPDWSPALGDERVQRVFRSGAEQMLQSLQQVRETVAEVNRQIGRLAERQTAAFADGVGEEIDAMSRCAREGLREIRAAATEEANALGDVATVASSRPAQPPAEAAPAQGPGSGADARRSPVADEDNVQAASEALREARQGADERRRRGSA